MSLLKKALLIICTLVGTIGLVAAHPTGTDKLLQLLRTTTDARKRIDLLLELKDLNEDTPLNIPYSIKLFREASAANDTYAMAVAVIPIVKRYAAYPEMEDSLHFYMTRLRESAPETPEKGIDQFAEMHIGYTRLRIDYDREQRLKTAREVLRWCDSTSTPPRDIFEQTKQLTISAYAQVVLAATEQHADEDYTPQIAAWERAYELTRQMPGLYVRRFFASSVYTLLSTAYIQARRYPELKALTTEYITLLDRYYHSEQQLKTRGHLHPGNTYVLPYRQLIYCSLGMKREDLARENFTEFQQRMLRVADDDDKLLNLSLLYEMGYLWKNISQQYDDGVLYCDSLVRLIETRSDKLYLSPEKVYRAYRNLSRQLRHAGRYTEAYAAYARTAGIQDSLISAERQQRIDAIRHSYEADSAKLKQARTQIRNRTFAIVLITAIALLLVATGIYLYRSLRRNRRLQLDIEHHSGKALESEHMKSTFINTICRGIEPPFNAIDDSVRKLMIAGINTPERKEHLENIRENIEVLLSTLDNMLEAANLDSLTDGLQLVDTDIDPICRTELLTASRLRHSSEVEYLIKAPVEVYRVYTHAKYFSFVIRALLDNAGKFTRRGTITLGYELRPEENLLRVTVTDTGCGIPPARRKDIFKPICEHSTASRGLSLSLCSLIAGHLAGTIRLDESYNAGARFIFTIPIKP